jgi:sugar phosphate isomerase/epimerase
MQLGIFAKTFVRPTLEMTLDAVEASGLRHIQFNMACVGMTSMPDRIDVDTARLIRRETERRGLVIDAVSGTYNMAHPDPEVRRAGLSRLHHLAAMCKDMGTAVITLCTGSRDPHDMWKFHPDNRKVDAWADMLASVEKALEIADHYGVTLAIEPEFNNVVYDAVRARQLLETMRSEKLKIVMDSANLCGPGQLHRIGDKMEEAFELLGEHLVLAHAKDVTEDPEFRHVAPGKGILDYGRYLSLLRQAGYEGPLIMHGLDESEVPDSVRFLREKLDEL